MTLFGFIRPWWPQKPHTEKLGAAPRPFENRAKTIAPPHGGASPLEKRPNLVPFEHYPVADAESRYIRRLRVLLIRASSLSMWSRTFSTVSTVARGAVAVAKATEGPCSSNGTERWLMR